MRQLTKRPTLGKLVSITMSAHRCEHMVRNVEGEHTTLMAKRGEMNWLASQSMIRAPLSPQVKVSWRLNQLARQAHVEASDKLHHRVLSDPVFVSFADASWDRLRVTMRLSLRWEELHRVVRFLGIHARCPRVAFIQFRGDTSCHTSTRRDQIHSTSVV